MRDEAGSGVLESWDAYSEIIAPMKSERRAFLEAMAREFGIRTVKNGRLVIFTGYLGWLEDVFDELGWDDPHPIDGDGGGRE